MYGIISSILIIVCFRIEGLSTNYKFETFVENFVRIYKKRRNEILTTNEAAVKALKVITENSFQAEKIQEEMEKEENVGLIVTS